MFPGAWYRKASSPFTDFFPLTVQVLRDLYLAPLPNPVDALNRAIVQQAGDYVWSRSLAIAAGETGEMLRRALTELMLTSGSLSPEGFDLTGLPASLRCRRHLEDLISFWRSLNGLLPDDFLVLKHVLESTASDAVEDIELYYDPDLADLSATERKVLEVLASRHPAPQDSADRVRRERELAASCRAPDGTVLGDIQRMLTRGQISKRPPDSTMQMFAVRDAHYEAEVAAGMVQLLLDGDETLRPADVGILIPNDETYSHIIRGSFDLAGLPLSGLPANRNQRDIGAEVVQLFLTVRRRPAPALALASLYTSPLMPWSAQTGRELARAVVDGDFSPRIINDLDGPGRAMFRLIRKDEEPDAGDLSRELSRLSELLQFSAEFSECRSKVKEMVEQINSFLNLAPIQSDTPWGEVIRLSEPRHIPSEGTLRTVGGIPVFTEAELPWRPVRHLVVLGFSEGAYPPKGRSNPFFLDSEIDLIRQKTGLALRTQAAAYSEGLERFRRHLANAQDSVRIFSPYRGLDGRRSSPSSTLPLMSRFFQGAGSPENVIVDLHSLSSESWPDVMPQPALLSAGQTLAPPIGDLDLGVNLLELRRDQEGNPRPQSPSRLEILAVSPLAWLLGELDAKDQLWEPETANPAVLGSVAHLVLEKLFVPGSIIPPEEQIRLTVPTLLDEAIRKIAPFLQAPVWSVERSTLLRQVMQAAVNWQRFILALEATVIDNEFWLSGTAERLAVRGKVDSLLQLPDGRTIIVDHKKSSSGKRIRRMEAGWDVQVHLYREMARSRSAAEDDEAALKAMSASPEIGVAYNMLNDGVVVVSGLALPNVTSAARMVDGDIAGQASNRLTEERQRLIAGKLRLNVEGDVKFYTQKAFMGAYAFDASPLVNAFSLRNTAEDEQEGAEDE